MISVATPADRARVVESLVATFRSDPVLRHLFPDDADYPAGAGAFFGHLFDKRVARESIWVVDGGRSAAIWEPPAVAGSPPAAELLLPEPAAGRMRAYDEAVHSVLPTDPFWYLGVLGTHPDHHGKRYGQAVMAAGLERARADGLPAYLETSTPGNVGMYERAGWKVVAELADPLPIWILTQ